jgi:hypothetical protein
MMRNWILLLKGIILYQPDLIYVLGMTSTLFGSHAQCKFVKQNKPFILFFTFDIYIYIIYI